VSNGDDSFQQDSVWVCHYYMIQLERMFLGSMLYLSDMLAGKMRNVLAGMLQYLLAGMLW
jgi:hypothetical protein